MSINKALESILNKNLDEMRTQFSNVLSTKAIEKLEERKIDIAQNYFGQFMEEEQLEEDYDANKAKESKHAAEMSKAARRGNRKKPQQILRKDQYQFSKLSGKLAKSAVTGMDEDVEHLDEKTIASKKSHKGTKWKVKSKNPDNEGSEVEVRQGKRVKDKGDYDRGAGAFFMKSGTYGSAKDMLKKRD